MAVNKVAFGNTTLIDLSEDTVEANALLLGYTAHNAAGELISGASPYGTIVDRSISIVTDPDGTLYGSKINHMTFGLCSELVSVNLPYVTEIASYAFWECVNLTTIAMPLCSSIASSAFTACESLEGLSLPECKNIYGSAFRECTGLSYLNLPKCSYIGASAFVLCSSLEVVEFGSSFISTAQYTFASCSNLRVFSAPTTTRFGSGVFANCISLETINTPNILSLTSNIFLNCCSLSEVNFPKLNRIYGNAFNGCSSLTSVDFPLVQYTLGAAAFANCISLSTVSLAICPNLGSNAFIRCSSLMSFYVLSTKVVTMSSTAVFSETPMADSSYTGAFGSIYVPASLVDSYKVAANWSFYADRITAYVEPT